MRLLMLLVATLLLIGCGKPEPIRAGGKPVAYWVESLKDPDARLRKKAAFKLGNVGQADAAAVPALIRALQDTDPGVRREAVLALVKCSAGARDAIGPLTEMQTRDRDPRVRESAAKAVAKLQTVK